MKGYVSLLDMMLSKSRDLVAELATVNSLNLLMLVGRICWTVAHKSTQLRLASDSQVDSLLQKLDELATETIDVWAALVAGKFGRSIEKGLATGELFTCSSHFPNHVNVKLLSN